MRCPNCETENSDDSRFCDECGFPLKGSISRKAGGASPAPVRPSYDRPFEERPALTPDFPSAPSEAAHPLEIPPDHGIQHEVRSDSLFSAKPAPKPHANQDQNSAFSSQQTRSSLSGPLNSNKLSYSAQNQPSYGDTRTLAPARESAPDPYSDSPFFHRDYDEERSFGTEFEAPIQDEFSFDDSTNQFNQFDSYSDSFETQAIPEPIDIYGNPLSENATEFIPKASDSTIAFPSQSKAYEQSEFESRAGNTLKFDEEDEFADFYRKPSVRKSKRNDESKNSKATRRKSQSISKPKMKGKQIGIIIGGIVVVAAALVAVIGFALGLWGGVAVPNVVGMSQEQATEILEDEGFTVKALQVKSDEVEGRVLIMDPGAGSLVEEGSEIVIHIATARTIPEIVGENIDEARRMLEESGYTNITVRSEFTDGEENIVLSVSPEPNTRAKSTMDVVVTISENYKVPDISGMSLEEAQGAIEDAGLEYQVIYIDTDQYPDGTVMGTDPEAGTKVSEGDLITINVSRMRGVELVALAEEYLAEGATVEIGGVNYQIESVTSISYEGNDTVAFTVSAKPFVTFFGETLFASSSQTLSGSIVYSSSNEIIAIG